MIVVIIAGGSGTRLWPLSTPDYPKHLLALTDENSLLQNTFARVSQLTQTDNIFVVSEKSHIEHVYKQLPEISKRNILVEPARRGTASCIAMSLTEIKDRNLDREESILFLWADHVIRDTDGFVATMLRAGEIAEVNRKLIFIGVEPTWPSSGFGYMKKGKQLNGWVSAYELDCFKEKPDKKIADEYFASGKYLWNTGYLVGSVETFEREMRQVSPELFSAYEVYQKSADKTKAYLDFVSQPLEYVFSEKVTDGAVVSGSFDWADVGSFYDLHDMSLQDNKGNHVRGNKVEIEQTSNSFVRNETDTPVAVIGVDNIVVVNTPSGVLVVNKNYAQNVGEIAKKLQEEL